MNGLLQVASVVCAASVACSIVAVIAPSGSHKKLIAAVLGLFIICTMINPVKNLLSGLSLPEVKTLTEEEIVSSGAYTEAVLAETESRLCSTLQSALSAEGIDIISLKIKLGLNDDGGIYIKYVRIYIPRRSNTRRSDIRSITVEQLALEPEIVTVKGQE